MLINCFLLSGVLILGLLPIFENIFTHANTQETIRIRMHCVLNDNIAQIGISDNGTGLTVTKIGQLQAMIDSNSPDVETTALLNISRRLKLSGCGFIKLALTETDGLEVIVILYRNKEA